MQELPPRQAPQPAEGQGAHVLPGLRLAFPGAVAVAAATGLVLTLAHPPAAAWPVAFVGLVPFLAVVRRAHPLRGFVLGFVMGGFYFLTLVYWVQIAAGWSAWISLCLASAMFLGAYGLLAPLLWREHHPIRSVIGLAALWAVMEWVRSMWPLGGFGWGALGYSQVDDRTLLPLASVTGVWGVSFVVVVVNGLLLLALDRILAARGGGAVPRRGSVRSVPILLVASALLVLAPGLIPIASAQGPTVSIAVVQGNDYPHGVPGDGLNEDLVIARSHAALHERLAGDPPDLAIWPENALDEDPTWQEPFRTLVQRAVRDVGVPTLIGAIGRDRQGREYNENLLYDGAGRVVGSYRKVHLVPFGEFVPWRRFLGWFHALQQIPLDLTPGRGTALLSLPGSGVTFTTVICYENSFPDLVRAAVGRGAGFLVVSTNTASFQVAAAARQHLAISRMRAVETGRWVVHAAVSGITAFVDPRGGVSRQTGLFQRTIDRGTVRVSSARTVYMRFGDWLPWGSAIVSLVLLLLPRRRRRREAAGPLPEDARTLVIVPTYNERRTIGEVIGRLASAVPRVDVLVVDDGSPDGTAEVVRAIAGSDPRVRLLERGEKGGLASAYMAGFRLGLDEGYALMVEMDADLSHRPEELPGLLETARRADLTVGSRYVPGGSVTNWGKLRLLLSRAGNAYARIALGMPVRDATSGFRVFRRGLLEHLLLDGIHSEGYGFQVELAYRAWRDGFAVGEAPITFREREHGHSKISRRIVIEALWLVTLWALRDRLRLPVQRWLPIDQDDDDSDHATEPPTRSDAPVVDEPPAEPPGRPREPEPLP